jgi:hypothetical protein
MKAGRLKARSGDIIAARDQGRAHTMLILTRRVGIQALLIAALAGASSARAAEEHCLVVQAMALAGYNERMQLLVGTDDIFTSAFHDQQVASKKVSEKYKALFAARNQRGSAENPENHNASFGSPAERTEYFHRWTIDINALEADQNSEIAVYTDAFKRAMDADPNPATRQRLARINALWNKEYHAPCYWGEPK